MPDYIEKNVIAANLNLESVPLIDDNGEPIDVNSCYINVTQIKRLDEYLLEKGLGEGIDFSKIGDRWIVPIVASDNRTIEIEVQKKVASIIPEIINYYSKDGELEKSEVLMIDDIINNKLSSFNKSIPAKDLYNTFVPKDVEDLARKISNGELDALDDPKKIAEILNIHLPPQIDHEREEKETSEEKELIEEKAIVKEKGESEELEEVNSNPNKKKNVNEISKEVSEEVSELLSQDEELRKSGGRLKQVVVVRNPKSIKNMVYDSGSIGNTELSDNQPVKIYRFTGGELLNDRIVMVQGQHVIDNRLYDKAISEHMHNVGSPEVDRLKDNESKYVYTDNDGNKFVADLVRQPDDLSLAQKEKIERQLQEIDNMCLSVKNSDMPEGEKSNQLIFLNQKRLKILAENGLNLPVVEDEVRADNEQNEEQVEDEKNQVNGPEEEGKDDEDNHYPSYEDGRIFPNPNKYKY